MYGLVHLSPFAMRDILPGWCEPTIIFHRAHNEAPLLYIMYSYMTRATSKFLFFRNVNNY